MLMFTPFMKYVDFSGRARRLEYWLFQLFQFLVYFVLIAIAMITIAGSISDRSAAGAVGGVMMFGLMGLFALACFLPNLAVTVRRLHDSNKSAWWLLLYAPGAFASASNFQMLGALGTGDPDAVMAAMMHGSFMSMIAGIANIVMFVFMLLPGTRGGNIFGPDPKGDQTADVARIFDAPDEDDARPAYAEAHKPVFDFGPSRGVPNVREAAASAAVQPRYTPPPQPAGNPLAPGAVRPTFGKRR